jgi:type II secretory pathway predicted ATPase ExeA
MMLDALVLGLDARTKVAQLSHTTISADELFDLLLSEFGLEDGAEGKLARLGRIQAFLDEWTAVGRNSVLVVDEAQNLSLSVLEEIRLLSNLRSQGQCSLQIVLAGQPEFRELLEREELRQLKQRIGIRYHLTPLSAGETGEYISHRLNVAGSNEPVFDRGALEAIFAYAGGVPRMINILCDRALVAGYGANKRRIGKELIAETIQDLEGAGFSATREAVAPEIPSGRGTGSPVAPPAEEPVEAPVAASADPELPSRPSAEPGERSPVIPEPVAVEPRVQRRPERRPRPQPRRRSAPEGVVGASVAYRRVPTWTLPAVIVVGALAVVAFSGLQTEWWRGIAGAWGERMSARSTVGEEQSRAAETEPTRDDASSGRGSVTGAMDGIVDTSVDEASAGESEAEAVSERAPSEAPAGGGDAETGTAEPVEPGPAGSVETEVAESLDRQERSGDVVNVETVTRAVDPAPRVALARGPGGAYRAVALSSRDSDAAAEVVSRLGDGGFSAEVIPVDIGDGSVWHRVVVAGGYPSLESAREAVDALKRLGYDGAWVHRE